MINQYRYHAGKFSKSFHVLKLTGSDLSTFLQAQATFDTDSLKNKNFHLVSFLDPQGRSEFYGWLLKESEACLLLIPNLLIDVALERLNRFLISEDVEIENLGAKNWWITVGALAHSHPPETSFVGEIFSDLGLLDSQEPQNLPLINDEEINLWQGLSGAPSFDGSDFQKELITNQRLFDLTVTMNKGCYPGQETVSKIATRRGAAYSPVLIKLSHPAPTGTLTLQGAKIGTSYACYPWEDSFYLATSILRDFRVEGLKLTFMTQDQEFSGTVKYYPLLASSSKDKALELFYAGSDAFRVDNLELAEENFRLAIKVDPNLADAYESLGVMLGRQERFPEAIELMQELVKVDPDSVLAHTNMSLYLMRLGKIEEAEEEKSKATLKSFKKFGDEAKQKEETEKRSAAEKAELAKRENMFKQVLEIDEDDTLANYGLGSIAVEKQDFGNAKTYLEKVIAVDDKYSVAYLALGRAYFGLGEKEKARETFKAGIKVAAAKGDLMPANQMQSELERF